MPLLDTSRVGRTLRLGADLVDLTDVVLARFISRS